MYLELSRPAGDVSRWEKVFKRLNLLNTHYPFVDSKCSKIKALRNFHGEEREIIQNSIRDTVVKESAIFLGDFAVNLYSKYMPILDSQSII
jgi:hypothetical protein